MHRVGIGVVPRIGLFGVGTPDRKSVALPISAAFESAGVKNGSRARALARVRGGAPREIFKAFLPIFEQIVGIFCFRS